MAGVSLLELPSNDGKIIAVNPHHVTAVQPYEGHVAGQQGRRPMCVIWVARDQGTNLFVCAWSIEQTLDVLNTAKRDDFEAFRNGWLAAHDPERSIKPELIWAAFCEWQGKDADLAEARPA